MRHHSTSIIGPDLDGPEMRECKCVDGPGPCGRFIKHTVRNDRQIEVCCGCGAETDVGPAWTGCIKASDLEPPSPYPSDLLAAIPWAKEASLRLVEAGHVFGYGKWIYVMPSHYYNAHTQEWTMMRGMKVEGMFGYYPTRAAALKSPPPKPPGFVEAPAQPSVGERLGLVAFYADPGVRHGKTGKNCRPMFACRTQRSPSPSAARCSKRDLRRRIRKRRRRRFGMQLSPESHGTNCERRAESLSGCKPVPPSPQPIPRAGRKWSIRRQNQRCSRRSFKVLPLEVHSLCSPVTKSSCGK